MFKLFEKTAKSEVAIAEPKAKLKGKTTVEIIEEIHESFFTEVDKLLQAAKISNSLDTDKQALIEKCERLKQIGFTNTKEVKEAETELARLEQLKKDNEAKKNLIEAINYFTMKYPAYKFITEDSVRKICEKYNLIYGEISRYTGTVPDKNLKQLEDFKVLEEDECYVLEERTRGFFMDATERTMRKEYRTFEKYKTSKEPKEPKEQQPDAYLLHLQMMQASNFHVRTIDMKCPLEIAAPQSDFNMTGMEVKNHKIQKIDIPDPVVLKPVIFNNMKYYLIITAWGIEASDEIVVNQRMN
jgi:hypothetical protein